MTYREPAPEPRWWGVGMRIDPRRAAVLALHWQVNVIEPEGFFGALLQYPGVVRLYLQECHGPAVGARVKLVEVERLISRHAVEITRKAHTHGLLRPIRPAISGLAVVGAVERLLLAVLSEEEDIGNPLELPDALTTLVLDGLRVPPPPPPGRRKLDAKPGRP